jgi:hypothetical protein
VWRAVKEGQATVTAGARFEVLGYAGLVPVPVDGGYVAEHFVLTVFPPAEPSTLRATLPPPQAATLIPQLDPSGQLQGSVDAIFSQDDTLYLNVGPTLAILKLADPRLPELAGAVELPVKSVSDIDVAAGYAYVAADEAGLRIVDVSNPSHLTEVGVYQPPLAGFASWPGPTRSGPETPGYLYAQGARSVVVKTAPEGPIYAYVAAQGAGLRIVDVSNPAAPHEVGFYETPSDAIGVAVANGYAYVAAFEAGLRVIDISQPAAPKEVASLIRPDEGWFLGVTATDRYVYIAEGLCNEYIGCHGFVKSIDVSNSAALTVVSHQAMGAPVTNIVMAGQYAYAVGWGLWPIDLTDPAQPVFYFPNLSYGYNWVKNATAAHSYLYLAAGMSGLRLVDVSDPAIPVKGKTLFAPVP